MARVESKTSDRLKALDEGTQAGTVDRTMWKVDHGRAVPAELGPTPANDRHHEQHCGVIDVFQNHVDRVRGEAIGLHPTRPGRCSTPRAESTKRKFSGSATHFFSPENAERSKVVAV